MGGRRKVRSANERIRNRSEVRNAGDYDRNQDLAEGRPMKRTADVVIIGGGCMGASVAYHLRAAASPTSSWSSARSCSPPDRPGATPAASGTSSRTKRTSGCRSSRSACSSASPTRSASRSTSIRTATCSCCRRPASVETFRAERRAAAQSRRRRRLARRRRGARGSRPASTPTASLARRSAQRDGIADPNGVTMGFAKAAQAAGVDDRARHRSHRHPRRGATASRRSRRLARHDRDTDAS